MEEQIKKLYYDVTSGLWSASRIAKKLGIKKKEVDTVLKKLLTVQVFKKPRRNYSSIMSAAPNNIVQMDLADYQNLSDHNKGYKYILNIIDINSRFVWSYLLTSKARESVKKVLLPLIVSKSFKNINIDDGSEFTWLKSYQDKLDFKLYIHRGNFNKTKQSIVERYNLTQRQLIEKYMMAYDTKTYYKVLPGLTKNYNSTEHTTTKAKPIEIYKGKAKSKQVYKTTELLPPGQKVRKEIYYNIFGKKTKPKYSKAVFTVSDVHGQSMTLKDKHNNELEGNYRPHMLLPIKHVESLVEHKERKEVKKKVKRKIAYIERHRKKWRVRREIFGKKKSYGVFATREKAEAKLKEIRKAL